VELLPARQKQIVELRYRHRLPLTGVSADVGWTVNAVKVALSKIRKTLLGCLRAKSLVEGSEPS
jgi:DNA-directed RNA polymerase specialized sigma24 family protein